MKNAKMFILMAAAMSYSKPKKYIDKELFEEKKKKEELTPGTREYVFEEGSFKCIARSIKNAEKKYQNWKIKFTTL